MKIDEQLQWEELFRLGGTEDELEVGKKFGRGGRITGKEKALALNFVLSLDFNNWNFSFYLFYSKKKTVLTGEFL